MRARDAIEELTATQVLASLPEPVLAVDATYRIRFVNHAAQQFLGAGESALLDTDLPLHFNRDSPLFALIDKVLADGSSLIEYDLDLESPKIARSSVNVRVTPVGRAINHVAVMIHPVSVAENIERQLSHRGAARSVTGLARLLAHEVKNPLSGIRGAAQLLGETQADEQDRLLTRLICDETDRIVRLVDRMEAFSETGPIAARPVNVHSVLDRVCRIAEKGFAAEVRITPRYDPSLPLVSGNEDQLVQVFLNLIKNAAEAAPKEGGEVVITTRFQRGVSIAVPGSAKKTSLPITISIQDNGNGVPEELRAHLFDPFVTTKSTGTGLGLALVAKILASHGGIIGFDSRPRRTEFQVSLPMAKATMRSGA